MRKTFFIIILFLTAMPLCQAQRLPSWMNELPKAGNNTIVYVVYKLLPQTADSTLLELFGGSQRAVWMSLLCSMCIFLPALFQVISRIRLKNS